MTFLRHIAFNMDWYWAERKRPMPKMAKERPVLFQQQETHLPLEDYDFFAFLAYIYYVPLYVAGPVINFNAFFLQVLTPQKTYSNTEIWKQLGWVLVYTLALEIWLHYFYFNAFNESRLWKSQNFDAIQTMLIGYWVLNFMYVKFLIIWRFFRVMALFDGMDSHENMNRCVNNNFTFSGFWRSWHGSLNKWIVRYMYVPLGGTKYIVGTVWIIFSFIGLWHDLQTRWLAWALLNCVFFCAEIVVLHFSSGINKRLQKTPIYRELIAFLAVCNIFLLMIANLAILHGFTYTPIFVKQAFWGESAWIADSLAVYCLWIGAMLMLEIRASETRSNDAKRF